MTGFFLRFVAYAIVALTRIVKERTHKGIS
jgi:hypothetical protein